MSTALAPQTYVPTPAISAEVDNVRRFLEAHAPLEGSPSREYLLTVDREGDQVALPRPFFDALLLVAEALASGRAVTVAPQAMLLTTQQAADLLGVSRPTVVRLADAGDLPSERHGNRRRIRLGDVLDYRDRRRAAQYAMLAATAVDLDDEEDIDVVRARLHEARQAASAARLAR